MTAPSTPSSLADKLAIPRPRKAKPEQSGLPALVSPSEKLALLGGLAPETFMRRYWQKKPLLIRNAIAGFKPLANAAELQRMAALSDVESRFISRSGSAKKPVWQVEYGPFKKGFFPKSGVPNWTMLVQGMDLHLDSAHELLQQFRFVPDARLDDLMVSYATDGGGVGPHFDSYDVFLLQAQGQRRWRIGRQSDLTLQEGVPLKLLARFKPEEEFVLNPGDMLYLPPQYAHDGIAIGECMTYSVGFRTPCRGEVVRELLLRWADRLDEQPNAQQRYSDPSQMPVAHPAELPSLFANWVSKAAKGLLPGEEDLQILWGEYLTEPKARVWFDPSMDAGDIDLAHSGCGVRLDRRTRMLVSKTHVFANGESWRAAGRDALLMAKLAHQRRLDAADLRKATVAARQLLAQWIDDGWAHCC
jgi:50S ribosomal protein L16 3-hydroxylase